jgi:hypothetical protein
MIRNYALTLGAVTLRLWLPLFLSLDYTFVESYATIAWLSWFPNLLVAELIIKNKKVGEHQQLVSSSIANHEAAQQIIGREGEPATLLKTPLVKS